jgi:hypothetical protein
MITKRVIRDWRGEGDAASVGEQVVGERGPDEDFNLSLRDRRVGELKGLERRREGKALLNSSA